MSIELFKAFEEITLPDTRRRAFVSLDYTTGQVRKSTLGALHASLALLSLNATVPDNIQNHFVTAKHLMLYSWFVYRFIPVAQMQAYASLEFALRERLVNSQNNAKKRSKTLVPLIKEAIRKGFLVDSRFSDWPGHKAPTEAASDRSTEWLETKLIKYLGHFRNDLAHGSFTLLPDGGFALRIAADGINQLYPSTVAEGT